MMFSKRCQKAEWQPMRSVPGLKGLGGGDNPSFTVFNQKKKIELVLNHFLQFLIWLEVRSPWEVRSYYNVFFPMCIHGEHRKCITSL